jgi:hypothetical protein
MQLPVTKLPRSTREYLEEILQKPEQSISEDERGFLRARREYLTGEQKAFYKVGDAKSEEPKALLSRPMLKSKLKEMGITFDEDMSNETLRDLIENPPKEDGSTMTKPQLKAELRKLEVEFDETASKDELYELLKEAQANL